MDVKKQMSTQRRHMNVVGGTDSAPSLREAVPRRNKQQQRAQSESSAREVPVIRQKKRSSSMEKTSTCDLCTLVQGHWTESGGLRKRTMFSDVTIRASDGDSFHCNSFVLAVWSKSLLKLAQCVKRRSGQEEWVIEMASFPGEIVHSALRFMYGGKATDLPPRDMPQIIKMAETYRMNDLKQACFVAAKTAVLEIESVCAMWAFAEEFKLSDAANRAMRFIYAHLEHVVANPDWARVSHRADMLEKLFEASVEWTSVNKDWRSWKQDDEGEGLSPFAQGVRAVWRDSNELSKKHAYSDKVIVSKSGRQFHVHTQIIHASSPDFAAFLHQEVEVTDMNMVYMDDMDDDVIEEFLRFVYRQEPSIAFPKLASMVHVLATTYDMAELKQMCEREMAVQQVTSISGALEMLREAEEHRMSTAKSAVFRYLYANLAELRQTDDWRTLIHDEPQLLTEMMLESKRFRRMTNPKE